ncbi:ferredoxin [Streptococcus hyointestinalis]|uniref:Ferredoxin n=1 Tax=Streptococcus hyointestinalis TaxID=1337 RepID=A0A380KBU2_9STRE|nr:ferredoxin [Streptococcus hyointestinalis]SUN62552.1 ferredoxin [Streptococcus hyointestinalis]
MKVRIIPEKCIACGLCQTYSALFDYDDEGIVVLANTDAKECPITPDDSDTITAVKSCPTKALTIL